MINDKKKYCYLLYCYPRYSIYRWYISWSTRASSSSVRCCLSSPFWCWSSSPLPSPLRPPPVPTHWEASTRTYTKSTAHSSLSPMAPSWETISQWDPFSRPLQNFLYPYGSLVIMINWRLLTRWLNKNLIWKFNSNCAVWSLCIMHNTIHKGAQISVTVHKCSYIERGLCRNEPS